ncbi:hypothetical protein [Polluticoccus soli]|uniref:hypothetical protein n=1 Tax=Polluticoccus soli TaxID=3034150 RepID=UPI0023E0A661|nr:hypothetical protein [Flavipsychrobacter sp. JY13-12]
MPRRWWLLAVIHSPYDAGSASFCSAVLQTEYSPDSSRQPAYKRKLEEAANKKAYDLPPQKKRETGQEYGN